ncbi:MAG: eukaryotic-like serine/threonine-protein kinase [Pyrinomonadaceae bacterium]|nr:eukaryotic-like serine/threonine-protein kinase [Pyrinomonadaceae bacterium]
MLGSTLLNYRITEKLGSGGQGTVYKAVDTRLGRTLVLKVLSPELTSRESNLKRFEREAQLASSLDHPNICIIYGLHEENGLHFITMQYIDGKNVRQLVKGRPLELRSAISITMQVADALAAAHARGVIHRDIKAGNVMVTKSGTAKVLDFGLAKLLDENKSSGSKSDQHLTEMGVPYGTATYAAPEQATGAHVDHRADIFSTGVLLYEMLAGIWPFQGKTNVEVRYAVLHDTPVPIAELRQDAPPRLQEILDRALAKDPKDRYQRVADMRDDLRAVKRELAAASPVTLDTTDEFEPVVPRHQSSNNSFGRTFRRWLRNITGNETASTAQSTSLPPSASRNISAAPHRTEGETQHGTNVSEGGQKSIAILPFRNLSGDAEVSFYEFSLADAVITELARLRSLVVRPSSLIVKYQGQQRDPREIGEELSVGAVLAASFLRAGDKLRVNAQLLDVASGDLLWSDRIDATADDIIAVQDTIAQRIVEGLRLELTTAERDGLAQRATANSDAYNIYLRGRDSMGRYIYHTLANEDVEEAIGSFKRAIELDPNFALAHCALGGCYANRVIKSMGDFEDYERAEEAFRKGLDIDPKIMEARMHMVFIYLARGEKAKARAAVENLRHEAPNDVGVQFVASYLYRLDGDYERSLRSLDRMLSLNPAERVVVSYNRARVLMYQGRMDDAMGELAEGAKIEPDHPFIRTFRAVALYRQGKAAEAAEILRDVLATHPEMDGIRPHYAIALSKIGQHEAARAQLTERVKEVAEADHDAPYWVATAYAVEGMRDQAFKWLERAINRGNENLPWFRANPEWTELRDDPRFEMLMGRIEKSHAQARVGVE